MPRQILNRIVCMISVLSVMAGSMLFSVPENTFADDNATVTDGSTQEEEGSTASDLWPESPEIMAPAAILMDLTTGAVLYSRNATEAMYPASTTKIMSVLLAIEQCPLTDIVTMSAEAVDSIGWDSSRIGVVAGEQLTMEECLYSILLASANEVCYAVAEHVGNGSAAAFVKMMNSRAEELGCVNTNFVNPHGLHDDNHYTCAYDLALIMKKCVEYTTFCRISDNYYYELPATNLTSEARLLAQTHQILRRKISYEGVYAGKTGHTDEAGNCLVTAAERDGVNLVCVVMGESSSDDCYTDTIALFDYGFDNFSYVNYGGASDDGRSAFPELFDEDTAFLSKQETVLSLTEATIVLPKDADTDYVTNQCELYTLIRLQKGQNIIGRAEFYYSGVKVGETDIIYNSETAEVLDAAADYYERLYGTDEFDETEYMSLLGILPEEPEEERDIRPMIIGIIVAVLVFVAGIFIIIRSSTRRR